MPGWASVSLLRASVIGSAPQCRGLKLITARQPTVFCLTPSRKVDLLCWSVFDTSGTWPWPFVPLRPAKLKAIITFKQPQFWPTPQTLIDAWQTLLVRLVTALIGTPSVKERMTTSPAFSIWIRLELTASISNITAEFCPVTWLTAPQTLFCCSTTQSLSTETISIQQPSSGSAAKTAICTRVNIPFRPKSVNTKAIYMPRILPCTPANIAASPLVISKVCPKRSFTQPYLRTPLKPRSSNRTTSWCLKLASSNPLISPWLSIFSKKLRPYTISDPYGLRPSES